MWRALRMAPWEWSLCSMRLRGRLATLAARQARCLKPRKQSRPRRKACSAALKVFLAASRCDCRGLVLFFLERVAERVGGIDPEHRQLLGKERQFFKRENQRPVVGMTLNVRVKLRGEEVAADHVAFELGHV